MKLGACVQETQCEKVYLESVIIFKNKDLVFYNDIFFLKIKEVVGICLKILEKVEKNTSKGIRR